jgi:hypothetical protein
MQTSSVSAVLCSIDGYVQMIFTFSNTTPFFLTKEAQRKPAIFLMSAFTAGQCIELSRSAYPNFIG